MKFLEKSLSDVAEVKELTVLLPYMPAEYFLKK